MFLYEKPRRAGGREGVSGMPTSARHASYTPEFTELHSRPHNPRPGTVALTLEGSI